MIQFSCGRLGSYAPSLHTRTHTHIYTNPYTRESHNSWQGICWRLIVLPSW